MSKALPTRKDVFSKDGRRYAGYAPATAGDANLPTGVRGTYKGPIYRLERQVRTRRGFGTLVHVIVSFTRTKAKAHQMAAGWVKIATKDR
jgi:hypothetical protein